MCAGVNSVNGSAVNGGARSQNRYLTVAVRRSCRCSAGLDCLLRAGPYATLRIIFQGRPLSTRAARSASRWTGEHDISAPVYRLWPRFELDPAYEKLLASN